MQADITKITPVPPEPTSERPYAQLDWLCERFIARYRKEPSKKAVRNTVHAYKIFLQKEYGYDEHLRDDPRFYLSVHWDQFFLYDLEQYWRAKGNASHTIYKRLIYLRHLFNLASAERLTAASFVLFPPVGNPTRETLQREAYEDAELELIRRIINPALEWARKIVSGYKPTGVVADTRRNKGPKGKSPVTRPQVQDDSGGTWSWDNFVWYFENILECKPLLPTRKNWNTHKRFCSAASRQYGSVEAVWRKLGVAPLVTIDLILPLAMKLAWETGLNTESLLELKRNCFQAAHPLTGLPFLRYYKERSTGEKELHLSLLDPAEVELPLSKRQAHVVQRTIDLILKLTEPLVVKAKDEDRDLLLLYQPLLQCALPPGTVYRLRTKFISIWMTRAIRNLRKEGGADVPITLNLARFRPTKITQMAREGRDICDIQSVAGHRSICTTLRYISERQIAPAARREVSETLQRIHDNRVSLERSPRPYALPGTQHQDGVIYKGILCDCKNVYDPPESVRRLPTYKEGQACTYYNMCLSCPNILITKKHLPILLSHKREIETALGNNNLRDAPNAALYEKNLAVLEGVFLEFDEEDLAWAEQVSECVDSCADPVTYRGVEHEH